MLGIVLGAGDAVESFWAGLPSLSSAKMDIITSSDVVRIPRGDPGKVGITGCLTGRAKPVVLSWGRFLPPPHLASLETYLVVKTEEEVLVTSMGRGQGCCLTSYNA